MKIHERIVSILASKNISKRDFAKMLIQREVRSIRTGEVLSEKVIYAYLNGSVSIRADIIPDICSALGVTEQELFDNSESKHIKLLHKILTKPTDFERQTAILLLKESNESYVPATELDKITKLLDYIPPLVLKETIATMQKYKDAFDSI